MRLGDVVVCEQGLRFSGLRLMGRRYRGSRVGTTPTLDGYKTPEREREAKKGSYPQWRVDHSNIRHASSAFKVGSGWLSVPDGITTYYGVTVGHSHPGTWLCHRTRLPWDKATSGHSCRRIRLPWDKATLGRGYSGTRYPGT